jgi:hypothetical protein
VDLVTNNTIRLLLIIAICFLPVATFSGHGEERIPNEYQVKAAFLFNFAKFVEWPADAFDGPDAPFILGVLGDNPFGSALGRIKGKTANGRKLLVYHFKEVDDINECHILFVSASEKEHLAKIFKALKHANILLVGDMENFAGQGGMINFIVKDQKIGFEINVDAVGSGNLIVSSKLLSLAKIVHGRPAGGGE